MMIRNLTKLILIIFFISTNCYSEIIQDIKIFGNKRISPETIKVLGDIKLNSYYSDEKINDLIKKLYETGFFKDVSILIDNEILQIQLIENAIVEDIQIVGIKNMSIVENLLETISLKKRKTFSEISLQNDITLIKNILKTNGFYFVNVKTFIDNNDELNSTSIKLEIDQGPQAKIKKITFIGNKIFKDKNILEVIASEEHMFWKFLSKNVYLNEQRINLDKRLITNYYKNLGYFNVKVLSSFAEFDKKGNFNLVYNIDAGKKFYFNDFVLDLPEDYNLKDFNKILNLFSKLKGKIYSLDEFNNIVSEIDDIASLKLYDFIDAKIEEKIVEDNKLNFTFKISDSMKFYVERINILGNYNTIEEVIRNRFIVDEGDPLNTLLYNKSIDNIRSLRIFENVSANIRDGSNSNYKEIDIIIEEKATGEISLAAGTGTSGTVIGGALVERNFLGKGINLNTNLELTESSIKGQFTYSRPNFAYTDNTLFTSFTSTTDDNISDFGYKVSKIGFSIGTKIEQFKNLFFSPSLDISNEDLETNSNASSSLKKQEGKYNDLYFKYGLTYDLRNSSYKPTSGNVSSFNQELPFVSDSNEISNSFTFTQYKKLSRNSDMIGKASLYLNTVNSLDGDVRISKRAYVPYNRLRGFEKGKIGPVDENNDYIGGNYVSTLNLQTSLPNILPTIENIDFSYFLDFANIWGVDYDKSVNDSNKIRSSTGFILDLLTPIGPLNFTLSQNLSKNSTDKTESFRFNLGTTF